MSSESISQSGEIESASIDKSIEGFDQFQRLDKAQLMSKLTEILDTKGDFDVDF